MRLLNARTYELTEFHPGQIPKYAILSHTWEQEEVLYEDLKYTQSYLNLLYGANQKSYHTKLGWKKIEYTCQQALKDSLSFVWVDTCCIDKTSSAELSEAINSMFLWYQRADCCYVYLADATRSSLSWWDLQRSPSRLPRWFSRGWTLQELIAPQNLVFYSSSWEHLGYKLELSDLLSQFTGIDEQVLRGKTNLSSVCVARKMSWAAKRKTTRPEDLAYCLLGIFGISMPPLYGEGDKAFLRLQEEIMKVADDHSLFAWVDYGALPKEPYGLLARQPSCFAACTSTVAFRDWTEIIPSTTSNLGISLTLPIFRQNNDTYGAILNCAWTDDFKGYKRVCLSLQMIPGTVNQYQRISVNRPDSTSRSTTDKAHIYIRQIPIQPSRFDVLPSSLCHIDVLSKGPYLDVTAYLHTDRASKSDDWYDHLVDQNIHAVSGRDGAAFSSAFHIPGAPDTLSVVLRIRSRMPLNSRGFPEESFTEEFFYVLLGSGTRSDFHPAIVIMRDTWRILGLEANNWSSTIASLRDAKKDRNSPAPIDERYGWEERQWEDNKPGYKRLTLKTNTRRRQIIQHFDLLAEGYKNQAAKYPPFQETLPESYETLDREISVSIRETPPESSARYEIAIECSPLVQSPMPDLVLEMPGIFEIGSDGDGHTAVSRDEKPPQGSMRAEEVIKRSAVVQSPMKNQAQQSSGIFPGARYSDEHSGSRSPILQPQVPLVIPGMFELE